MDIAAGISELLFEHECVVLPGFGGFITNEKPAQLNPVTHQFRPPFREILFNVQLIANDGLLAKHIAEKESISYRLAKQKVEQFIAWCRTELEAGRQTEFIKIGNLSFDNVRNIAFEQDHQINYNPDSFGLNSLVSPAIKRASQEEKIKDIILPVSGIKKRTDRKAERISDKKSSKSKRSVYRFPIAIAALLFAVVLITSMFLPQKSSMISIAGLFPSSSTEIEIVPNENQVQQKDAKPVIEEVSLPIAESADETVEREIVLDIGNETGFVKNDDKIVEESPEERKAVEPELVPDNTKAAINKTAAKLKSVGRQYYIIAGSFSKEENANKLIAQLAEKGYSATVADTNKNGMYRVAYAGFSDKADAKQELLAIRQGENAEAWLLRK